MAGSIAAASASHLNCQRRRASATRKRRTSRTTSRTSVATRAGRRIAVSTFASTAGIVPNTCGEDWSGGMNGPGAVAATAMNTAATAKIAASRPRSPRPPRAIGKEQHQHGDRHVDQHPRALTCGRHVRRAPRVAGISALGQLAGDRQSRDQPGHRRPGPQRPALARAGRPAGPRGRVSRPAPEPTPAAPRGQVSADPVSVAAPRSTAAVTPATVSAIGRCHPIFEA